MDNHSKTEELVTLKQSLERQNKLLSDYQKIQLYNWMVSLDSLNNISVKNEDDKTQHLYDLIHGEMAIFYIENGMCEMCIRKELSNLNRITKIIGRNNVILLANGFSSRYLYNSESFKNWRDNLFQSKEAPTADNDNLSGTPSLVIVDGNSLVSR